jgi:predicted nucleic acid-binding protein
LFDTDVSSLMWRDAMPWQFDRQLLGLNAAVTFGGLSWKEEIPEAYGFLRGEAAAAGYTLGQNDCWIAACCVSHGLPLLTRNRKHFEPLEPLGLVLI